MAKSAPAAINPALLIWAREGAGYSLDEAARRLSLSPDRLRACEAGLERLTFRKLEDAARVYHRPLAVFFLPSAPQPEISVHDFRLDPAIVGSVPAPSVQLELRRARQHRDEALALSRELGESVQRFSGEASIDEPPERVGERVRDMLGLARIPPKAWGNADGALKARKAAIEALNVLVFEVSRVPTEQMRGAAIWFDELPVIILNGADAPSARSFTLLHEFTHLLLRQGGICDLAPSEAATSDARTERFCNAVAAAVLMPANELEQIVRDPEPREWTLDELGGLAQIFRVSRESMLVRLITLGRSTFHHYLEMRPQFRDEYIRFKEAQKKPDANGGPSPAVMAVRNLGRPFVRRVIAAYEEDRIGLATASDYLGVKLRHLDRIRELLAAPSEAA